MPAACRGHFALEPQGTRFANAHNFSFRLFYHATKSHPVRFRQQFFSGDAFFAASSAEGEFRIIQ
jgi:hypothetical protein